VSDLISMLKRHEGRSLKPYLCTADKLTIGYGRNLEDMGISEDEATYLLQTDIDRCYSELSVFTWFHELDQIRQEALISMLFNLGLPRFLTFKKMIARLMAKEYSQAAEEIINSLYARQVGDRANELAYMIERGEYLK
jgi:lysozyme